MIRMEQINYTNLLVMTSSIQPESTVINISSSININCGVYWDIENVNVQSGQSADQFIKLIRDKLIRPKGLKEIEFICAYVRGRVTKTIEGQIESSGVTIRELEKAPNAADDCLVKSIRQFIESYGDGCNIILISGDSDFVKTLIRCKIKYGAKIYLIHGKNAHNDFLDAIADELYLLNDGHLQLVTGSCDFAVIKVTLSPEVNYVSTIESDLKSMFEHQGAIKDCIYLDENDPKCPGIGVWIGFPSKELAKNVAKDKVNKSYRNHPLDVKYVQYPPSHIINELKKYNVSTIRAETWSLLRVLIPNSFSLTRSSSITSTLSLPFKAKKSAYLIITGFPISYSQSKRRNHLSRILDKKFILFDSLRSNKDYFALKVSKLSEAKRFIDKIKNDNELKLSTSISKRLPKRNDIIVQPNLILQGGVIEIQSSDDIMETHFDVDTCSRLRIFKLICFILIIIFIIIVIIWIIIKILL